MMILFCWREWSIKVYLKKNTHTSNSTERKWKIKWWWNWPEDGCGFVFRSRGCVQQLLCRVFSSFGRQSYLMVRCHLLWVWLTGTCVLPVNTHAAGRELSFHDAGFKSSAVKVQGSNEAWCLNESRRNEQVFDEQLQWLRQTDNTSVYWVCRV